MEMSEKCATLSANSTVLHFMVPVEPMRVHDLKLSCMKCNERVNKGRQFRQILTALGR